MKDEQTKAAVIQWLVPSLVLIAVVVVMLFNFSAKSSQSAATEVENNLINVAEKYAAKVNYTLAAMSEAGKPVGALMEIYIAMGKIPTDMSETLCSFSDAYAVLYCTEEGVGTLQDMTKRYISRCDYYPLIDEEQRVIVEDGNGRIWKNEDGVRYIFTEDDGLGNEKKAVISVIPLDGSVEKDKLLMYYPVTKLKELFKKTEFDADAFYALVDSSGHIMESTGSKSLFLAAPNLWETIGQSGNNDAIVKATVRMKNRSSGSFSTVVGGEARRLVYAPVGINDWAILIGINQEYVDSQQNREWSNAKQMIYQLVVAILVFLGLVVVINIINKIKSSEKSKELEEKADTDLLTGLNNKLATERKIKEYMETCPGEQALMFVLDIDNFKKINDTLGHAFGDEVLRSLGHQISAVFRATDVVGRTGGDEFTVFLKHLNDDSLLEKEARKLCNFFKNFQAGEYVKYAATASIGAAVFPRDGKDFESLYKAADNALYIAKKRGKNQLAFYGDDSKKSECVRKAEEESRVKE